MRGAKREVISRSYNLLLRTTLHAGFSDAQCGFKAIRADRARALLPLVEDTGWFFDTELLVLAERAGLRIHEVPVDWVDDPDSRVDIWSTAVADLKGVWRLGRGLWSGRIPLSAIREQTEAEAAARAPVGLIGEALRFGTVGVVSTLAYVVLFVGLRQALPAQAANALALAVTFVANTAANRAPHLRRARRADAPAPPPPGPRRVRPRPRPHRRRPGRCSTPSPPAPAPPSQTTVLVVVNALVTVARFLLLRHWVFPTTDRRPTPRTAG